jgi:exopolysaccharide biosynthesis polyprenyl glycosylphosphotransferase
MKPLEIFFGVLRIPVDFLLTITAFFLAYQIRLSTDLIPGIQLPVTTSTFPEYGEYLVITTIATILLLVIFSQFQLYSLKRPETLSKQISKVFAASMIWLFSIITYYFLLRTFPFSRLALLQSWLFTVVLLILGRSLLQYFQNRLYRKGIAQTRVLLVGTGEITPALLSNYFKNPQYHCVGYLETEDKNLPRIPYLGDLEKLEEISRKHHVEKIIQCKNQMNNRQEISLLDFCHEHQIEYSFIPDQLEMQRTNIDIDTPSGIPVITLKPTPLDGWGRVLKRAFDFIVALLLIILLSPVMLIISLLIFIDDPRGTIIFKYLDDGSRVKRVGLKSRQFPFYKFRTMKPNTHNLRYTELAHLNLRQGTPMVKIKTDPRVTRIGRFLRQTSLDELPQLFNVLKGEMSLVGPRPHLPEEVANYQRHHKFVFTIKPGITGMAQVSGRSDLDFEQEVRLDSYYIENWSIWLDLKILFQTLLVPFKKFEE